MELSGRLQELQNEVNCMNDSKDFQDAESVRSGTSHVTSQPMLFPKHPIPEGLLRPSFVSPRRKEGLPDIWDTPDKSGNVFANPQASFTAPYLQEMNPWRKIIEEPLHMSTAEKSERPEQNQDLRCQSGPSAKDSVIFNGGRLFKELWSRPTTTADFGSPFWQVFHASNLRLLEDKVQDRGMYLFTHFLRRRCNGSRKWSWLIQWMNWDLRHLLVVFQCRIFEVLDARVASALNKINYNSHWKEESVWRNKRPRKRTVSFAADRLPTGSTITSRSLGAMILSKTIPTCSLLFFEMTIFRNSILSGTEFYCLWRISHMMTSWKDCTN